jgi:AraC-like DNA-binding protein
MEQVMHYALDNFTRDISLDEVATLAHLTKEAFCRFFKQHTRKTFIQFLQEVRLNHALQLIKHEKKTVSEAAFASGFNNLSYFNRLFKRTYGHSPSTFLQQR